MLNSVAKQYAFKCISHQVRVYAHVVHRLTSRVIVLRHDKICLYLPEAFAVDFRNKPPLPAELLAARFNLRQCCAVVSRNPALVPAPIKELLYAALFGG